MITEREIVAEVGAERLRSARGSVLRLGAVGFWCRLMPQVAGLPAAHESWWSCHRARMDEGTAKNDHSARSWRDKSTINTT